MSTLINIIKGDITSLKVDVIVNAANSQLAGGGGVDGAIHRTGGPSIMKECQEWIAENGMCEPGNAMITHGGELKAKYVIHTVGPIWKGGKNKEESILRDAYRKCLDLCKEYGLSSIAFPNISTGVYGFPKTRAARVATVAVQKWIDENPGEIDDVIFCCFDEENFNLYQQLLR
jgi:O-acetyl-ADP-ribose deacetylase